mmetsp:Transcript_120005/g.299328  ORF Transcript_120005/g.299328 Transcript_120005/m.299328 type:complete len:215 (-) Transcript_120005:287-931(-)
MALCKNAAVVAVVAVISVTLLGCSKCPVEWQQDIGKECSGDKAVTPDASKEANKCTCEKLNEMLPDVKQHCNDDDQKEMKTKLEIGFAVVSCKALKRTGYVPSPGHPMPKFGIKTLTDASPSNSTKLAARTMAIDAMVAAAPRQGSRADDDGAGVILAVAERAGWMALGALLMAAACLAFRSRIQVREAKVGLAPAPQQAEVELPSAGAAAATV